MPGGERSYPTDCTDFHHLLLAACSLADSGGEIWESDLWDAPEIVERFEGSPELLAAYNEGLKLAEIFAGDALERCREILTDIEQQELFTVTALRDCRNDSLRRNYKKRYVAFFAGVLQSAT